MKISTSIREKLVIMLPFGYYFVGPLIFISYFLSISLIKLRMKIGYFIFVLLLIYLIIYHLILSGFESILQIRYFWGWVLFFMFFSTCRFDQAHFLFLRKILITMCLYTLTEAVVINYFIDASTLPNFHKDRLVASSHFSDIYQRPYSFGGNPAVTTTLLIVMGLMTRLQLWHKILLALTVTVSGSATGMLLFMLSVIFEKKNTKSFIFFIFILGAIFSSYFYFAPDGYFGREKMKTDYFMIIINDKWANISLFIDQTEILDMIFGKISGSADYGGDFPFFTMMVNFGLFGLLMLGLFIFYASSRSVLAPIFMLTLGSLHYGAMFSLPGQMLLGLLLAGGLCSNWQGANDQVR